MYNVVLDLFFNSPIKFPHSPPSLFFLVLDCRTVAAIFLPQRQLGSGSAQKLPDQATGGFIIHPLLRDSGSSVDYSKVLR